MSEQQPIIITNGNDNELIAELSTELNSYDLRRLAGKEWLNDKVNQFQCSSAQWLFCKTISSASIYCSSPTDHDEISSSSPI